MKSNRKQKQKQKSNTPMSSQMCLNTNGMNMHASYVYGDGYSNPYIYPKANILWH